MAIISSFLMIQNKWIIQSDEWVNWYGHVVVVFWWYSYGSVGI